MLNTKKIFFILSFWLAIAPVVLVASELSLGKILLTYRNEVLDDIEMEDCPKRREAISGMLKKQAATCRNDLEMVANGVPSHSTDTWQNINDVDAFFFDGG